MSGLSGIIVESLKVLQNNYGIAMIAIGGLVGYPYFREFNKANLEREERDLIVNNKEYKEYKLRLTELSHRPPVEPEKMAEYIKNGMMAFHEGNHESVKNGWISANQATPKK